MSKLNLGVILIIQVTSMAYLSGCATTTDSTINRADWKAGWIHEIIEGKDLQNINEKECISDLSSKNIMNSRYAVVWYMTGGRRRIAKTLLIPSGMQLKSGDVVRINVYDCAKGIIAGE